MRLKDVLREWVCHYKLSQHVMSVLCAVVTILIVINNDEPEISFMKEN